MNIDIGISIHMIDSTQMRFLNLKDTAPRSFSKCSTNPRFNYLLQMKKKATTNDDAMSAINFVAENLISGASSPKMSEVNNLQITPVMISLRLSKHLTKSSKCKLAFNLIFKASSLMKNVHLLIYLLFLAKIYLIFTTLLKNSFK